MSVPAARPQEEPAIRGTEPGDRAAGRTLAPGWRVLMWVGLLVVFGLALAPLTLAVRGMDEITRMAAGAAISLLSGLAASWTMLHFVDRRERPMAALGFALGRHAWREWWLGTAVGCATIAVAAGLLTVAGSARWVADAGSIPEYVAELAGMFAFFAVAAASEEVLMRGYAFQAAVEGIGVWPAIGVFSLIFGAMHAMNPNFTLLGGANIVLAGVLLSVAYLRTRSLWFATGVHLGWNWLMGAVLDLPVSGLDTDAPLLDVVSAGPEWWSGGAFGPEAGAAATVTLAAATVWLLRWRHLREAPATRAAVPLVDRRIGPDWPR